MRVGRDPATRRVGQRRLLPWHVVAYEEPPGRTEDRRMEIFKRLVVLQDSGIGVRESRAHISLEFGLTPEEAVAIEEEGVERGWPPLDSP